ncbi:MAG TPA: hypothetical protein VEQ11_14840 [Chloroflexota bacterium]|nr:hypothetical protein [Chloroflexota bacterium]
MDPGGVEEQFMEATDRLLPALDALAERHGLLEQRERLRELGANPYVRSDVDPRLTALVHRLALAIIAESLVPEQDERQRT